MGRATLVALAVGLLGALGVVLLGLGGEAVMPSYLGAWLLLVALPLGALPVLMGCELLDAPETALVANLRRLAAIMPLAAALAAAGAARDGLALPGAVGRQSRPAGLVDDARLLRGAAVLFLAVWSALSLVFSRPAPGAGWTRRRPLLAGLGLALHLVMGTLAAFDWAQEVEPSFNSSAFGLC